MSISLSYSFLTYWLVLAIMLQRAAHLLPNKQAAIGLAVLAPLIILIIPVNNLPVIYYLRGALGDMSIVTTILLLGVIVSKYYNFKMLDENTSKVFYVIIFIFGLIFYVSSLGVGQFDAYSIGYGRLVVPLLLVAVAFPCLLRKFYSLGLLLLLPVIVYKSGLLESNNAWDYVLDPFLWLYSAGRTFNYIISFFRERNPV